jgi:circadian clock protein KaiB
MAQPHEPRRQEFVLYVSGMSVRSVAAIENMHRIGREYLGGDFTMTIVDVGQEKAEAVRHQIVAIPTLIRVWPLPERTIIGDLSDTEKIVRYLGL